ncbi:MAG: peptidylprolyl isomerase [Lysobacterales bacterium]|nr:MAG: peptidylprolyl isomerase [Xanthomonadales bacterium]
MRHSHALAITATILLLAAGCTKTDTAAAGAADAAVKPVAMVDGAAISQEVWNLYVKARHAGKTPDELTPEQRTATLDELISMYVGAQEAKKQMLTTGEDGARIELVHTSSMTELLFKKFVDGKDATEEELKAEYDARIADLPKTEFHARHILVDDEAKAKDLIAQIDKGASFEKLATENSKDGSATKGGDLDWFMASQMVKPFADALQQLEVGKYTATPVKSEFGWHVIKLEETRAATPPPYESVKPQLGPMVQQKKFEAHLKELVKTAKIERTPAEIAK